MSNDNLEEIRKLNKKSAANKAASHIPSGDMASNTNDILFKEIKKTDERSVIDLTINGIAKAAIPTMSSSNSNVDLKK